MTATTTANAMTTATAWRIGGSEPIHVKNNCAVTDSPSRRGAEKRVGATLRDPLKWRKKEGRPAGRPSSFDQLEGQPVWI